MERQTGCVHIYCGDGKGKTTCGMGLCVRAAGFGYRVLIYQFMKDNGTSERKAMDIAVQVEEKRELREAMIYMQKYGISNALALRM